MLTRRHLRIKVMQSLYSFLPNREGNLGQEIDFFKKSYFNTFSLYLTLLAFLKSTYEHSLGLKDLQKKLRTKKKSEQSPSLAGNKILQFIAKHPILVNHINKRKIKFWELDFDYVKSNFKTLEESEKYQEYSQKESPSVEEDRDIITFFYKEIVAPSVGFYDYIEDKELTWIDDLPVVNTFIIKILQKINPKDLNSLSFPKMNIEDEDPRFAIELLEKVIISLSSSTEGLSFWLYS